MEIRARSEITVKWYDFIGQDEGGVVCMEGWQDLPKKNSLKKTFLDNERHDND